MADPAVVPCPADQWTKIATSVSAATLHLLNFKPKKYSWTYRDTGGGAPIDLADAVELRSDTALSFGALADVYVYPQGDAGSVRVDT